MPRIIEPGAEEMPCVSGSPLASQARFTERPPSEKTTCGVVVFRATSLLNVITLWPATVSAFVALVALAALSAVEA